MPAEPRRGCSGRCASWSRFPESAPQQAQLTLNLKEPGGRECSAAGAERPMSSSRISGRTSKPASASTTRRCAKINPRLVYASIRASARTGHTQSSRFRSDRAGHGRLHVDHRSRARVRCAPVSRSPICSAGIFSRWASSSRCSSAKCRARGNGCRRRLLQAQIAMLDFQATRWLMDGKVPAQAGNDHPTIDADRRVRDGGRLPEHRRDRTGAVGAVLPRARDEGMAHRPALRQGIGPFGEQSGPQQLDRRTPAHAAEPRVDEPSPDPRSRPDLFTASTKSSPTHRCGTSASPRRFILPPWAARSRSCASPFP